MHLRDLGLHQGINSILLMLSEANHGQTDIACGIYPLSLLSVNRMVLAP